MFKRWTKPNLRSNKTAFFTFTEPKINSIDDQIETRSNSTNLLIINVIRANSHSIEMTFFLRTFVTNFCFCYRMKAKMNFNKKWTTLTEKPFPIFSEEKRLFSDTKENNVSTTINQHECEEKKQNVVNLPVVKSMFAANEHKTTCALITNTKNKKHTNQVIYFQCLDHTKFNKKTQHSIQCWKKTYWKQLSVSFMSIDEQFDCICFATVQCITSNLLWHSWWNGTEIIDNRPKTKHSPTPFTRIQSIS